MGPLLLRAVRAGPLLVRAMVFRFRGVGFSTLGLQKARPLQAEAPPHAAPPGPERSGPGAPAGRQAFQRTKTGSSRFKRLK